MSGGGRAPWWYSGDDEGEPSADQPGAAADLPSADEPGADADGASSAMDWTALVAGAAKMVDWATERVMAPHAEHTDPAEHPDCMVCRTVTLIGDPVGLMSSGQRRSADEEGAGERLDPPSTEAAGTTGAQPIRWIPIVESRD